LFIQLVVGFLDDDDDEASLDAASRDASVTSLDVRFDLETARDGLVVIETTPASFDVRSDFHTSILLMDVDVKHSAAHHILGFEAEERRSPGKAGMAGRIYHRQEIYF
jgi:hypothetical protein